MSTEQPMTDNDSYSREYTNTLLEISAARVESRAVDNIRDLNLKLATEIGSLNGIHLTLVKNLFDFDKIESVVTGKARKWDKGFAGVVLTSVVGRLLDPKFNPSDDFYSCNPRPLFENHIGPVLRDRYKAPMGLSDPLNVAKGTKKFTKDWANRGRGGKFNISALAVVEYVEWIATADKDELLQLLDTLVWIYLSLRNILHLETPELESGLGIDYVFTLIETLIQKAPAGGATAQTIIELIIIIQHGLTGTGSIVKGTGGSVNATNRTSGKFADVWEEFDASWHGYEVTTKIININRVNESESGVLAYIDKFPAHPPLLEITFLCLLEKLNIVDFPLQTHYISENNVHYYFLDIYQWIKIMLDRITASGRKILLEGIHTYVRDSKTDFSVKTLWNTIAIPHKDL